MLRYLLEKEFKQIKRDKFMPRILFIIPILQLIILPFAANFEMKNISLNFVDHDHSTLSTQLKEKILSSGYFCLSNSSEQYRHALTSIENNQTDIIVEIPARFEHNLHKNGSAQLLIAANAVNGTKGGLGTSYLANIVNDFNHEQGWSASIQNGITSLQLYNPHLSYKVFMVPGIMVFLLTVISGFLSALNIVSEKERGTIEQINVSPISKPIFLLSKLIPFWIIGFILLTIAITVGYLVYGLSPIGSYGIIYLFAAIYLIAFTGFGLTISCISSTQQQAMLSAFFVMIIFVLLSGLFTPISSMPTWAQTLTNFNPIRYFIEVMRMVYLKGSTFADLRYHFLITCIFALFFNLLAVVTYQKKK